MGPINPLALEEFNELQERHDVPRGAARRRARHPPRAVAGDQGRRPGDPDRVRRGVRRRQRATSPSCSTTLFPGGIGRLVLTNPDDLLNTGIEVEAKPSGKNVKKLSLLSGGERSLTALAYLFAVFRSRPSPFYVMDEVEAALDDVNLHRFLGLINEFRKEAQLLIVSHQKRTMDAGDCLLGVTHAARRFVEGRHRAGVQHRLLSSLAPVRPTIYLILIAAVIVFGLAVILPQPPLVRAGRHRADDRASGRSRHSSASTAGPPRS